MSQTNDQKASNEDKIDEFEQVVTHKAKEVQTEFGKGFENMTKTFKSQTENLDENLKPVMQELGEIKQNFQKQIKTPIGTKVIAAIFSGLCVGVLIWIVIGFLSQNSNPSVISWILGIVLLQIADSLSGFSGHIQRIFARLLQDKK